jgi:hypothetical protein
MTPNANPKSNVFDPLCWAWTNHKRIETTDRTASPACVTQDGVLTDMLQKMCAATVERLHALHRAQIIGYVNTHTHTGPCTPAQSTTPVPALATSHACHERVANMLFS